MQETTAAAVRPGSLRAWLLATRPVTLSGALIPILLAGALAWSDGLLHGVAPWIALAGCAGFAGAMQIAANLINDLYDYERGTDRADRLGPPRACAEGWITPRAMRRGMWLTIGVACLLGLVAIAPMAGRLPWHGLEYVALGLVCVAFAFLYTTRLSYMGWGDVLVVVFFGLVPVGGTYYLLASALPPACWLLGLISGTAIDALLVVNNYRDREQDRLSGKRTLAVRLGGPATERLYLALGVAVVALVVALAAEMQRSAIVLPVTVVYLAFHIRTWQRMVAIGHGRALNAVLGETSRNMLLMALVLAASIIWL